MAVGIPSEVARFVSPADVLTSGAMPVDENVPAGAFLLVTVAGGSSTANFGVSDSNNHTWLSTPKSVIATGAASGNQIFYTRVVDPLVAGVDTITATRNVAGGFEVVAYQVAGVDVDAPLGNGGVVEFTSNGNLDPITGATVDPVSGELALLLASSQDNRTVSGVGTGWTLTHDVVSTGGANPRRSVLIHRLAVDATPLTGVIDLSAGGAWATTALVLAAEPPPSPWRVRVGGVWVPATAHVLP